MTTTHTPQDSSTDLLSFETPRNQSAATPMNPFERAAQYGAAPIVPQAQTTAVASRPHAHAQAQTDLLTLESNTMATLHAKDESTATTTTMIAHSPQNDLLQQEIAQVTIGENETTCRQKEQAVLPLYQRSFKVDFIGKRRPQSKQQVTWVLVHGTTAHTVMLTWSTQTGKVTIHLDGDEVHFSDGGYSIIQRKFDRDGLHYDILACDKRPNHADADFLCHECIINGQAFSELPCAKENRLLMTTVDSPQVVVPDEHCDSSSYSEEEDESASYEYDGVPYSVTDIVYPNGIPSYT